MSRKVLLIEDDQDFAHLVRLHRQDLGCEVKVAHEGTAGLEQALNKPYDLIITIQRAEPFSGFRGSSPNCS